MPPQDTADLTYRYATAASCQQPPSGGTDRMQFRNRVLTGGREKRRNSQGSKLRELPKNDVSKMTYVSLAGVMQEPGIPGPFAVVGVL